MNEPIHVCNVCGKAFDALDEQENFGFKYYVGFGSKYDTRHLEAHVCIDCFDKLMDRFISECKISPDKGEYRICGENDLCDTELFSENVDIT